MKNSLKIQFLFLGLVLLVILGLSRWQKPQASTTPSSNNLKVAFMDVGQGDAILFTTLNNKHVLVDGGPDSTVLTRLGEEMPFWDHTIDLVIASHNHSDHIAGLNKVMERYDVKQMWISGAIHTTNEYIRMLEEIKTHGIPTQVVYKGKTEDIDGLHLEVVHPIESAEGTRPANQHDATVVVRAEFGTKHFLLTGDINEDHEQLMIDSGVNLQSDVLKVAHHGSASGLALNFLNAINPTYAVIQVGAKNNYGHPAPSVLEKLINKGITTYRTDQNSTIHAITDGTTLKVEPSR